MSSATRLLTVEDDGRVRLPADLREKLGLKQGDMVAAVETPDGLLLTSQQTVIEHDLAQADAELRKYGLTLDELVESGREIRGEIARERYDLGE